MQLQSTFPAMPLPYEAQVVWEARDPTTGDLVDGVTITDPVLYGLNLNPPEQTAPVKPAATPLWLPEPSTPGAGATETTSSDTVTT